MNLPLKDKRDVARSSVKTSSKLIKRLLSTADPRPLPRPDCQEPHHDSLSMWASFFALISAVFISAYTAIFFKYPHISVMYLGFTILSHTLILRYFYCTRCDHYDNECASILYAPQVTRLLFKRREGTWTRVDTIAGTSTWLIISQAGASIAAFHHSIPFVFLNLLAWLAWRTVHSALACRRCLNNHVCPKGKAAVAGENYLAVILFTVIPLPAIAWVAGYFG